MERDLERFWHVHAYVSGQWYNTEYGQVEYSDRWYGPTMIFLEGLSYKLMKEVAA